MTQRHICRQYLCAVTEEFTEGIDALLSTKEYEELITAQDEHKGKLQSGTCAVTLLVQTTPAVQETASGQMFRQEQLGDESLRLSFSLGKEGMLGRLIPGSLFYQRDDIGDREGTQKALPGSCRRGVLG